MQKCSDNRDGDHHHDVDDDVHDQHHVHDDSHEHHHESHSEHDVDHGRYHHQHHDDDHHLCPQTPLDYPNIFEKLGPLKPRPSFFQNYRFEPSNPFSRVERKKLCRLRKVSAS